MQLSDPLPSAQLSWSLLLRRPFQRRSSAGGFLSSVGGFLALLGWHIAQVSRLHKAAVLTAERMDARAQGLDASLVLEGENNNLALITVFRVAYSLESFSLS